MGAKRGVETSLIPQSGFDGTFVSVTGISRKLSLRALKFVTQQFLATMRSVTLFRRWNVRAVVSVGGYASLPAVIAASRHTPTDHCGELRPDPWPGEPVWRAGQP